MKPYKKSYALRVDETLFEKLKQVAACNHRSLNAQIESLIEKCVLEHEEQKGEISIDTNELYQ